MVKTSLIRLAGIAWLTLAAAALAQPPSGLPVFPGAEGFGTRTRAGRGGTVLEVTTLADHGPGSLREALDQSFPRTIVFRVGGTIELEGHLFIPQPFVTVAGQTAPGGGICLKGFGLAIATNDVLVQHLRIRPGNLAAVAPDVNDAIVVMGATDETPSSYNVVLDHISTSWGEDELISTWFGPSDITISWSIISEALDQSRHLKGHHSAGLLIGDGTKNVSVHHCLLAHNDFRNPLISMGGMHDFINNVVYDWGVLSTEILDLESNTFLNFVANNYLPGPSTLFGSYEIMIDVEAGVPLLFTQGNLGPRALPGEADDWAVVKYGWDEDVGPAPKTFRSLDRFPAPPVTTFPAPEAYRQVLALAGATSPARDAVDARVVEEVKSGGGKIINSPDEVGGHPVLASGQPPVDTDHDGMPDEWERQRGLDPHEPSNAGFDLDSRGYTNLEVYLHSLTPPVPTAGSFRRGDTNLDGAVDLSDPVASLGSLFLGGNPPLCPDAADADDDGRVDVTDPVVVLEILFLTTGPLPSPGYQDCGPDPTADELPPCNADCHRAG